MCSILYVTSFAEDMYNSTGHRLIDTFNETKQLGDLLVCYENFEFKSEVRNIISYPLHKNEYLNNWLKKYDDQIPIEYGGKATKSNNLKLYQNINNYKASRWFRKVASLNYALEVYGNKYDWIIWVDSDCYFLKQIPLSFYNDLSGSYFYYLGLRKNHKKYGVETGFVGFRNLMGYKMLQKWIDAFDGKFLSYIRWDDGWVFKEVLKENRWKDGCDLGLPAKQSHLMDDENTLLYEYFRHDKGIHRKRKIMP